MKISYSFRCHISSLTTKILGTSAHYHRRHWFERIRAQHSVNPVDHGPREDGKQPRETPFRITKRVSHSRRAVSISIFSHCCKACFPILTKNNDFVDCRTNISLLLFRTRARTCFWKQSLSYGWIVQHAFALWTWPFLTASMQCKLWQGDCLCTPQPLCSISAGSNQEHQWNDRGNSHHSFPVSYQLLPGPCAIVKASGLTAPDAISSISSEPTVHALQSTSKSPSHTLTFVQSDPYEM